MMDEVFAVAFPTVAATPDASTITAALLLSALFVLLHLERRRRARMRR